MFQFCSLPTVCIHSVYCHSFPFRSKEENDEDHDGKQQPQDEDDEENDSPESDQSEDAAVRKKRNDLLSSLSDRKRRLKVREIVFAFNPDTVYGNRSGMAPGALVTATRLLRACS